MTVDDLLEMRAILAASPLGSAVFALVELDEELTSRGVFVTDGVVTRFEMGGGAPELEVVSRE